MTYHPTHRDERTADLPVTEPAKSDDGASAGTATVFTCPLHRVRRRGRAAFSTTPPPPPPKPVKRPSRIAITLALGHKIEQAILEGKLRDRADAARRLGLSRARVSQICDLTLLASDIQESLLCSEQRTGVPMELVGALRIAVTQQDWGLQRGTLSAGRCDSEEAGHA